MCGIAGVVALDRRPVDPRVAERAIACLVHRGPNGVGAVAKGPIAMAHRRLSVLDPSDAGAQPMTRDGLTLCHNGEVYNFLELARELRATGVELHTGTDTEVILAAYRAWGLAAFERFNGMWAMALWDEERGRLVLSRDRLGVKPLYIRRSGRSLAWASEPPALVAAAPLDDSDTWRPEPYLPVVRDFLGRGLVDHVHKTFVDGIESVPPGSHLLVEGASVQSRRYWDIPGFSDDNSTEARPEDEVLVQRFGELLADAVRLRLRADVALGSCLSGGLDSSTIVQLVSDQLRGGAGEREQAPRFAFHARFPAEGVDESGYARAVAAKAGVELVYAEPPRDLLAAIEEVLRIQGAPVASSSIVAQHEVMRATALRGVTVLLDGQGADEILGGYPRYVGYRAADLMLHSPVRAARELRLAVRRGTIGPATAIMGLARGLAGDAARERLRAASLGRFGMRMGPALRGIDSVASHDDRPGTLLAQRLWRDTSSEGLPALLRYEDRNSMAFGVEARVPFLDYRLVEMSFALPDRLKVGEGRTKVVLRRAMNGRLPRSVVDRRDKMGFVAPQAAWTSRTRERIAAVLRGGRAVDRGWVGEAEVERLVGAADTPGAVNDQLWRLLVTELWVRQLEGGPTLGPDGSVSDAAHA